MNLKKISAIALGAVAAAGVATAALASSGSTDTTFNAIGDMLVGWFSGSLGKVIAIASLGVGLAMGIVQQSVMAAVIGVSMALVVTYGPDILEGIVASAGI